MIDTETKTRLERMRDRIAPAQRLSGDPLHLLEILWAELDDIIRSDSPPCTPHSMAEYSYEVPAGVHWTGIPGDEIQRDDDDGRFEGDFEAALEVAEKCSLPWLLYVKPDAHAVAAGAEDRWTISAFPTWDAGNRESPSNHATTLLFDSRFYVLIPADDGNGFKGVAPRTA